MKTIKLLKVACIAIVLNAALFMNSAISQTTPTILIDGVSGMANNVSVAPYWLNAGQTLAIENKVNSISVLQYNIAPAPGGGNSLQFESVLSVTTQQAVPIGKTWKIESVFLDKTAILSQSGDNWGSQVAQTNAVLNGNGSGNSPLGIAQQGASIGQSLQWNGTAWLPANPVNTNVTLTGNGTASLPLGIAQQGALTSQVLTWNGSQWAPAVSSGVPSGVIVMWSGIISTIPIGWVICDGTNGTPNLKDKFIAGAGSTYAVGATGGEATHTLTVNEIPAHNHGLYNNDGGGSVYGVAQQTGGPGGGTNTWMQTKNNGGGAAFENRPPYYALAYIMKL